MTRHTLSRPYALLWASIFTAICVAVLLTQVANDVQKMIASPTVVELILPAFVVFCAIVLIALSLSEWRTVAHLVGLTFLLLLAAVPTFIGVIARDYGWPSWWLLPAIGFWMLVGIAAVSSTTHQMWMQFLLWLGAATSTLALISLLGTYGPNPFARTLIREARAMSLVLDIRMTLAVIFASLALVTAAVRAFDKRWPQLPKIPIVQVPKFPVNRAVLGPLMNPPIFAINAGLFVIVFLANVMVGTASMITLAILRTGAELGSLLWDLLFHENTVVKLFRTMAAIIAAFGLVIVALESADALKSYLVLEQRSVGLALRVIGVASIVLVGSTLIALAIDGRETVIQRALFGASLVATMLLMSGGLIYGIALVELLDVQGWSQVGYITLSGLVLAIIGVVGAVYGNATSKPNRPEFANPD